jgi:hypothetical protein
MMRTLILFTAAWILAGCGSSSEPGQNPEDDIRAWVERGEAAAEAKDRSGLLDLISENYADTRGNDRSKIGDTLRVLFFRQNNIALLTSIDDIQFMGDSAALVNVTVGMAGTRNAGIGLNADAYAFEFELEKQGEEWLLIGSRWGELGGSLH